MTATHVKPLPVMFRIHHGELVAYFPTEEERNGHITCYAHVGQHSTASRDWLRMGRPAQEHEYRALLAELRSIYETGPGDNVLLTVVAAPPVTLNFPSSGK